jgi:AraC-like DNA-binding protein
MEIATLKAKVAQYLAAKRQDMPGILVFQQQSPSKIESAVYEPVLCLILQGSKATSVGDQCVLLEAGQALTVSHTLPVISEIIEASPAQPYIALILSLDMQLIDDLKRQLADVPLPTSETRSLAAGPFEDAWAVPLMRYLELAASPVDARILGPTALREIHYRLLLCNTGGMLRSLLVENGHAGRIAKAIAALRSDFRKPLRIPDLAKTAAMSESSFYNHFKTVTGTTPLQYQKDLRLIEAHALLTKMSYTVADAAFAVGYESPNQFSRDYSRKFGVPPSKGGRANTSLD